MCGQRKFFKIMIESVVKFISLADGKIAKVEGGCQKVKISRKPFLKTVERNGRSILDLWRIYQENTTLRPASNYYCRE